MAKDQSTLLKAATGYLNGKIEDDETTVGEALNNDIVQFFAKLMDLAGLTFNDLYDNETNDYQFIDALVDKIETVITSQTIVDRGDPATADFDKADLTLNGTFQDLNLSSIIPANARYATLRVLSYTDTIDGANLSLSFRKKGNTNQQNIGYHGNRTFGAVQSIKGNDILVFLDSNRTIQYAGTETNMSIISITVASWGF